MKHIYRFALTLALFALSSTTVSAAQPETMSHQGRVLTDSGDVINDVVPFVFTIYDAPTDGNALWTESHGNVELVESVYSVVLGSSTPLTLAFDQPYFLEVTVDGDVMGRTELTSVPYALRSKIHPGQVDEAALTFDPVTQPELQDALAALQSQIDALTAQLATAGKPYILGLSSAAFRGGQVVNGEAGTLAATELCKSTFPAEASPHLCTVPEIDRALSEASFDQSLPSVAHNVETWTVFSGFDGYSTSSSVNNTCHAMSYVTGHIGRGTTLWMFFDTPSASGSPLSDYYNIQFGRACALSLPVLCCR